MKPLILLIEDNDGIAITWRHALEPHANVKWAATLREGIIMCAEIPPPDVILLDLRMPDSPNEVDTLNAIATLQKLAPQSYVLIVSGYITPEIIALAMAKGAHGVHEKLSIQRTTDLWTNIQEAVNRGPSTSQQSLASYISDIISKLTQTLHLL